MKPKGQFKPVLVLRAEIQNGRLQIHLSAPMRWLAAFAALSGVLIGSGPVTQLLNTLARLPR